jgi:hypothetical protein
MNGTAKNPDLVEGQLFNPDIPDGDNFDKTETIKDQHYNNTKLSSLPRNGAYFTLPQQRMVNPRLESFSMDGAIDPNNIRRRLDPNNARPDDFQTGNQGEKFGVPKGALKAINSVGLIQKAHQSYLNYKNRFALNTQQEKQSSVKK